MAVTSLVVMSSRAWPAPLATGPVDAVVRVPGSKSASNRALILAAIADGPSRLEAVLDARDTRLMAQGLAALGVQVDRIARPAGDGNVDLVITPHHLRGPAQVDVGLAGTVMRFLPPVAALAFGDIGFDGDAGARERPMATVIESLRDLGVEVRDADRGRLPFTVVGRGEVRGGEVTVDASRSSQFVSGLLLSAARFDTGLTLHHVGAPIPSMPHIDMTVAMLAEHGVRVVRDGAHVWHIDPHTIAPVDRTIEPDLSNAAPFLAVAMVAGGSVTVPDWPAHTTQPGDALRDLLARMGARVERTDAGLRVTGSGAIHGITVDLGEVGELTPTLAALAALADSPSTFTGIAHLRGHETDRLAALTTELTRLGCGARELPDGLEISPAAMTGTTVQTYADHRMATFAAVIGLAVPDVLIADVETTSKTLPDFTARWSALVGDAA